jgi:hypothetical protein
VGFLSDYTRMQAIGQTRGGRFALALDHPSRRRCRRG